MIGDLKRLFTMKTLWILINITCAGILAVQLFHVLTGYLKPTITRTGEKDSPSVEYKHPALPQHFFSSRETTLTSKISASLDWKYKLKLASQLLSPLRLTTL